LPDSARAAPIPTTANSRLARLLMGIEIRLFLVIDAFSRFCGTPIACSAGLFLQLAKQLLDSTATASGRGLASVDAGVTAGPWRRLGKAPFTPRITRFLLPANTRQAVHEGVGSMNAATELQLHLRTCILLPKRTC